jgi:HNH endonuclease
LRFSGEIAMKRIYIAGKSKDSWFQIAPEVRKGYKINLAKRDDLKCSNNNGNGCSKRFPLNMLSVDHIIPISMGGYVCDIHNMQLLCFRCHKRKSINIDNKRRSFEDGKKKDPIDTDDRDGRNHPQNNSNGSLNMQSSEMETICQQHT